ncbi:hypothetical protein [uncultured Amnibacterium sp.]|uniref:hypothetical protein n=1 Tax=uncultured Amnibacterium sp. TaxID=1631851 RepID=UPI0035CBA4B1
MSLQQITPPKSDTLDRSLTGNVLKQGSMDTLVKRRASGVVVVLPVGSGGIVDVE